MSALYPSIEPYDAGMLPVSHVHTVYYEQCGNPKGHPVIFLHGGPGGGVGADDRRYFDPTFYRIILMDQRGAGRSTPHACLEDNTTWHLVEDVEKLRNHLGISSWSIFGGSWGSTLALAYAETHTDRVESMVLRGIFTLRREELIWFYQEGAHFIYPDYWEEYLAPIPPSERSDMMGAYYRRLTGPSEEERLACAKAWTTWEMATCKLFVDPAIVAKGDDPKFSLAFARIECHYFVNAGFFEEDGQLIKDAHRLRHIPCTIVQGRYDIVCPMKSAWDLHRAWPEAKLVVVNDAGHSAKEAGISAKLVEACNEIRDIKLYGSKAASSVSDLDARVTVFAPFAPSSSTTTTTTTSVTRTYGGSSASTTSHASGGGSGSGVYSGSGGYGNSGSVNTVSGTGTYSSNNGGGSGSGVYGSSGGGYGSSSGGAPTPSRTFTSSSSGAGSVRLATAGAAAASPSRPHSSHTKSSTVRLDPAAQPAAGVPSHGFAHVSTKFHDANKESSAADAQLGQPPRIRRLQPPGGPSHEIFG